jgi:hypothetical protein
MTTVKAYRAKALEIHITCEQLMNSFIVEFFHPEITTMPIFEKGDIQHMFEKILLDKIMFRGKIEIIENIFNEEDCVKKLMKQYTNLILKNNKIHIKTEHGELNPKDFINNLLKINRIRNHLAHSPLVENTVGPMKGFERLKGTRLDKDYKGDIKEFDKAYEYIILFLGSIESNATSQLIAEVKKLTSS